jgi:hypothetical protein
MGPKIEKVDWGGLPWCSHRLQEVLGSGADDAQESSWSRCFEEIGHTWAASLSHWAIEVMGQSALCAILLPVDVSLVSRVLGSGKFFLAWLPSLSLEKLLPCGPMCHLF